MNKIPDDLIGEIIKQYEGGITTTQLANKYGLSRSGMGNLLKRNGVILRKGQPRKHRFDEHFFDCIDTAEKAYILGFLFSDGTIDPKRYMVILRIGEVDIDILRDIRRVWINSPPIYYTKPQKVTSQRQCSIGWYSKYLVQRLEELGCTRKKSLTLKFPEMPDEHIRHFIRGYFDGDGTILYGNYQTRSGIRIRFMGTMSFLRSVKDYLERQGLEGGLMRRVEKGDLWSVCNLSYNGRNALRVLAWLYEGASLYLERKHKRYLEQSDCSA